MAKRRAIVPGVVIIPVTDWKAVPVIFDIGMACRILQKNNESVRKMVVSGELPAQKTGGEWRIRKDHIMAYLGYQPWEIDRYGFGIRPER